MSEGDGVLLHAKPAGVTSHDVVLGVRRSLTRGTKVGHAGTLDPFATGLLLVLVGRATRAQRFFMALPKTYRAVARLGFSSDTGDPDGTITETGRLPERLEIPEGAQLQRPPDFSAVKVGGRRAYELARQGVPVETEPRLVTVRRAELLWEREGRAAFEIECSSGTYVRSLISDLGDAYCEQLERTAIGPFRLAAADSERLLPLGEALRFLPERSLSPEDAQAVRHGRSCPSRAHPAEPGASGLAGAGADAPHVRLTHGAELIAIAEPRAAELRPVVVFSPA